MDHSMDDGVVDQGMRALSAIAGLASSADLLRMIWRWLQEPAALVSIGSGMIGALGLLCWTRHRSVHKLRSFDQRITGRLESIRDKERKFIP